MITYIPLFYGAPCGSLDDIFDDDTHDYLPVPESLSYGKKLFSIQVTGNSMIDANIESGDCIIVDGSQQSAETTVGRIIVASVDNKITIKRLRISDDGYILQPENPAYKPYHIQKYEEFHVMGVVISVQKEVR